MVFKGRKIPVDEIKFDAIVDPRKGALSISQEAPFDLVKSALKNALFASC